MKIYLDHHATTPCDPRVVASMAPYWMESFGNAASRSHAWGLTARQATERARGQLSLRLGCSPKEIVFTSGATEANNLALLGVLRAGLRRRVVTVATEHKAVLDPTRQLEREGFEVTVLPVQADGRVDLEQVRAALGPDALLSVMWANNETGVLQPLAELVELAHSVGALVHTDAAQALATEAIDLRTLDVDLLSCSAHKAYGPKGVGALVVRRRRPALELQPLQFGGGHERGLRSGTLPVPLLVGFGEAVASYDPVDVERIRALRDRLLQGLLELGGVQLNGSAAHRLPSNLNLTIEGVEAKALLLGCPDLAMSSGSACTSASLEPSHVLRAMGLHEHSGNTVRIGLGRFNDAEQIDVALERLRSKITEIRALTAL